MLAREHHLIRSGQVLFSGKGFSGKAFAAETAALVLAVAAPGPRVRELPQRQPRWCPAWIELVN